MPTYRNARIIYDEIFGPTSYFVHGARKLYASEIMKKAMMSITSETPPPGLMPAAHWKSLRGGIHSGLVDINSVGSYHGWMQDTRLLGTSPMPHIETALGATDMGAQLRMDVAMWYGALTRNSYAKQAKMLRRMFLILQRVGMFVRSKGLQWQQWHNHGSGSVPLASALSHGGRVMVQIPAGNLGNRVWRWLWGTMRPERHKRKGATHDTMLRSKPEVIRARNVNFEKLFDELQPKLGGGGDHFGVNVPLGGEGNMNPFSGNTVSLSGEHGHLYVHFKAPHTKKAGTILFGCEDSAPIDVWNPGAGAKTAFVKTMVKKRFGNKHDPTHKSVITLGDPDAANPRRMATRGFCVGQTGHAHGFGDSGHFSGTGGMKWKDTRWHPEVGPHVGRDAMFVDLTDKFVAQAILNMRSSQFHSHHLGRDCNPPAYMAMHLAVTP